MLQTIEEVGIEKIAVHHIAPRLMLKEKTCEITVSAPKKPKVMENQVIQNR